MLASKGKLEASFAFVDCLSALAIMTGTLAVAVFFLPHIEAKTIGMNLLASPRNRRVMLSWMLAFLINETCSSASDGGGNLVMETSMRVLSATKALEALNVYRANWSARSKGRRSTLGRNAIREGLRLESLENRVVFSGASTMAVNDLYEAIVDEPLQVETGGVLANDIDAEGDDLQALEFFSPKHGELELNEDGTFVYTPEPGFTGIDGFVYQVDDGTSSSALAAVTIEVVHPNVMPTGENDFYSLEEDSVLDVLAENGVLVNDQDENGDSLSVEVVDLPQNGSLDLQTDGSFRFTPDFDFHGTDAFTYRISDGSSSSDLVVVELQVTAVNDAPVASGESYSVDEDDVIEVQSGTLLANDFDSDSDDLTVFLEQGPSGGTLELDADGGFRYQPDPDFHGTDQFTYHVSDGALTSDIVSVDILVNSVVDLPQANNDFIDTAEDSPLLIPSDALMSNDEMGELTGASLVLADLPENGDLQVDENGDLTYTPDANFHGSDAFTYRLGDGDTLSDLAVVEIEIQSLNDAPIAEADEFQTNAGESLSITPEQLVANDLDPEGDSLTVEIVEPPAHGTLSQSDTGEWVYQADEGYAGPDEFLYSVTDGQESSTASVVINVVAMEIDVPNAINEAYSVERGGVLNIDADLGLLANEPGNAVTPLEMILFRGPQNGVLDWNSDGSFSYSPNEDFVGIDSILYRTSMDDSASRLAVATLYVTEPEITPESDESSGEEIVVEVPADEMADQILLDTNLEVGGEIALEETTGNPHECWDSLFASGDDFWFEIRGVFS
ncbi:MAG: Ig-like domain-containing protein [Aureliella sp.]